MTAVYNYDPTTRAFSGSSEAEESPLETGVFLLPAHATNLVPPKTEKCQVAVFTGESWVVKPDYRGTGLYRTTDGQPISIHEIGKIPSDIGATEAEPPEISKQEVTVFVDGRWTVSPDWRGVRLFSTDDGQPVSINDIGITPGDVDATESPRPSPVHVWIKGAWSIDETLAARHAEDEKSAQIKAIASAVQMHLDEQAQRMGYESIFTAITYATEPAVPSFQADGIALRAWRSLVWAKCYELQAEVEAGTRAVMSAQELIALLPEPL